MDFDEYLKTATQARTEQEHTEARIKLMVAEAEFKRLNHERAPQEAMDNFLGGVDYNDMLKLAKQHYPEKFI